MSCFTTLRVRAARRPALALLACLFVFGGLGAKGPGQAQVAAPSHLAVNGLAAAFDLDVAPRFGWHVPVAEQAAFELRVSSTREKAEAAEGDVWASGKVSSAQQHDVRYAGPPLAASERYFWTVRIWGPQGASPWARVASFGTGPGASWPNSVPIWAAPLHSSWADYTLRAHLTIDEVALGLRFRSPDSLNGYLWQFRGADNRLVPHRLVNGTFSVIENVVLPAGTLALGKPAEVRIEAFQSTLRTFIDGVLVHTLEDATFSRGGVGVRTGNSESGRVAELSLEDTAGNTLFASDFAEADGSFACGSVRDSAWLVPRASNCLNAGASVDWAFLRKDFTLADQPIAWATAYATGGSPLPAKQYVYKLSLNGKPVGLGPTQSTAAETRYDGFDVTEAMLPGTTNTLGVLAYTTSGQKFQAELVVGYADGTREVIGSDATWQALPGDSSFPAAGSIGTSYYTAPRENLDA
ncbi:MAG TPA: hypothetical protein VJU61_27745, partial [Polyangiaceae bacterium]|nr:hypothetical protein [Polyangiaceae bacterium]